MPDRRRVSPAPDTASGLPPDPGQHAMQIAAELDRRLQGVVFTREAADPLIAAISARVRLPD